jgi:hypothetical protein
MMHLPRFAHIFKAADYAVLSLGWKRSLMLSFTPLPRQDDLRYTAVNRHYKITGKTCID